MFTSNLTPLLAAERVRDLRTARSPRIGGAPLRRRHAR